MSSKLRSFLKRRLSHTAYADVRWCEAVLLRRGERVTFCHVAVTSDDVFVADLAGRTLSTLLHTRHITDVTLETDKAEFLSGAVQEMSTHIVVRVPGKPPSSAARSSTTSKNSATPRGSSEIRRRSSDQVRRMSSGDMPKPVSFASKKFSSSSEGSRSRKHSPATESLGPTCYDGSGLIKKNSGARVTGFLRGLWSGKTYSSQPSLASSQQKLSPPLSPLSPDYPHSPESPHSTPGSPTTGSCISLPYTSLSSTPLPSSSTPSSSKRRFSAYPERRASEASLSPPKLTAPSPSPSFSSCLLPNLRVPQPSYLSASSPSHRKFQRSSSNSTLDGLNTATHDYPYITNGGPGQSPSPGPFAYLALDGRKLTPPSPRPLSPSPTLSASVSSPMLPMLLRGDLSSRGEVAKTGEMCPMGVLQRSVSALDTRVTPVAVQLRSYSVMDALRPAPPRHTPRDLEVAGLEAKVAEEQVIHLYTLTANTLLYKLLYTLWRNRRRVRNGRSFDGGQGTRTPLTDHGGSPPQVGEGAAVPASVEEGFWQLKAEFLGAQRLEQRYLLLRELNSGLKKLSRIKILFWQDSSLLSLLMSLLAQYLAGKHKGFLEGLRDNRNGVLDGDDDDENGGRELRYSELSSQHQEQRQDELEMCLLLYDTLALSLQGPHQYMMKVMSRDDYKVAASLLSCILTPATVPAGIRLTCDRWLTDTTCYSEMAWENLPYASVVQLVARCVRLSAVTAHQLLQAVIEQTVTPHLPALFRACHVKPWLRFAVPQMLAAVRGEVSSWDTSLGGSHPGELLHQYLALLGILLENSAKARRFCHRHYREELKYFITESNVRSLLSGDGQAQELCVALVANIRDSLWT